MSQSGDGGGVCVCVCVHHITVWLWLTVSIGFSGVVNATRVGGWVGVVQKTHKTLENGCFYRNSPHPFTVAASLQ